MNQTSDKSGRKQSTSGLASEAAGASASPFFSKTPSIAPKPSALQTPKHLRSPFSSTVFATAQSSIRGINSFANDDSSENGRSESEALQSMEQMAKEAKRKPARVSIGAMPMKGNLLDGSIASSGSESEDEPVKKKQKPNLEAQSEDQDDDEEEGLMEDVNQAKDKGLSGNENDDNDWTAVWEEATTVTPMLPEEEVENPHQESLRKLEKWTKELLATKKKLEDARLENALLLNKIYEVGGNWDRCD